MRVSRAWSSEPQLTPMRTGCWFSTAASTMVRKLSSCFPTDVDVSGIDAVLREGPGAVGVLLQQQVAVVMEVADDGDADAELVQVSTIVGTARGGVFIVDGDANDFRAGVGQRHHLFTVARRRRCRCWSSTGRRRVVAADLHTAYVDRHRSPARNAAITDCLRG